VDCADAVERRLADVPAREVPVLRKPIAELPKVGRTDLDSHLTRVTALVRSGRMKRAEACITRDSCPKRTNSHRSAFAGDCFRLREGRELRRTLSLSGEHETTPPRRVGLRGLKRRAEGDLISLKFPAIRCERPLRASRVGFRVAPELMR
jgi:hypothetical protein